MGSPDSGSKSKIEDKVRYMEDEEKEGLRDIIRMPEEVWEIEERFRKSQLWESLQWAPLDPREGRWEEKSIYLQVQLTRKTDYCLWFAVPIKDLLDGTAAAGDKKALLPVLGKEPRMLQRTVAFPPNRIVALGGSFPKNTVRKRTPQDADSVSCYDVKDPGKGWQKFPSMLAERDYPTVVVFEGKIYVFGGLRAPFTALSFLEIFHPDVQKWYRVEYLTKEMPPVYGNIPGLFYTDEGRKHFVFHSSPVQPRRSIYTFDLVDDSIKFGETPFPQLYHGCQVVDGILYAYVDHTSDVRAYDLSYKIWLPGPVIESHLLKCGISQLLQVGDNMLCVVQEDYVLIDASLEDGPRALHLTFRVFELDKEDDGDCISVGALFVSSRSFYCPDGGCLWDSLII